MQGLFKAWLTEKESALSEVQTGNFKDPSELNSNVRQLAVSRSPLECLVKFIHEVAYVLNISICCTYKHALIPVMTHIFNRLRQTAY